MGHASLPLDFVPREYCSWQHRFDDIQRGFRTLYCARFQVTALREVLASHRVDTAALREFRGLFGDAAELPAGHVTAEWRRQFVLTPARIEILSGKLVNIDDVGLRRRLEREHAALLEQHGMAYLDISQIRSKTRAVTQTLSRSLYAERVAGIVFRSDLDDQPCAALFEDRARLVPDGEPISLLQPHGTLLRVSREFHLRLG